jgi:hypothetical protein
MERTDHIATGSSWWRASRRLADATFGLWLQWRQPGGTVLPMRLVGDEAELAIATRLAQRAEPD